MALQNRIALIILLFPEALAPYSRMVFSTSFLSCLNTLSLKSLAFFDWICAARKSSIISSFIEKKLLNRISKTILNALFVKYLRN